MKFSPKEQIKCLNNSLYFERALFVVGPPNAGKSYQIRDMFRDVRLNNNGNRLIGTPRKKYNLSNERKLHVRITSPHESGDDWDTFVKKILKTVQNGRWNFVCAMQTDPTNMQTDQSIKMPFLIDSVTRFLNTFNPERIRICFIYPTYKKLNIQPRLIYETIESLHKINKVECCVIDGTNFNGLFLADFFDFT